jgi:hypothetical protein
VTPDEDLTDLQAVEVSGSGLVWSNGAVLAQCAAGPTDIDDCEPDFTFVVTTGGSFTADYPVSAVIDTWNHGPVDCRDPGACVLAVSSSYSTSPAKSAFVPLTFDPDTEVIAGTITIDPDTDLVDGQTVTVTVTGSHPTAGSTSSSVRAIRRGRPASTCPTSHSLTARVSWRPPT